MGDNGLILWVKKIKYIYKDKGYQQVQGEKFYDSGVLGIENSERLLGEL